VSQTSDAWSTALAAEHAAIFGYGVVGAHLDAATQGPAREAEAVHRSRRDALIVRIADASATPPASAAAYQLPFAVTDRASALRLAVALEEGAARAWRPAIGVTTGDERKLALEALTDCSIRATRWRQLAGVFPALVPFPGANS
jgi:ferritin-like protein